MSETRFAAIGAHLQLDDAAGVEGVSMFEIGPLFLSAADFEVPEGLASRAVVLRVAELRRQLAAKETFVAIRYGLSFATPLEALAKCAAHLTVWNRVLREYRGSCEMTVKVATGKKFERPDRHDFTKGKDYLSALKAAREEQSAPGEVRSTLEEAFAKQAARVRWVERDDGATELALLVRRDAIDLVRESAELLKTALPNVPFLLSGPWPLETFADGE